MKKRRWRTIKKEQPHAERTDGSFCVPRKAHFDELRRGTLNRISQFDLLWRGLRRGNRMRFLG
ncbi:MAG: hypothetical protein WBW36_06695, partial [Candidatus Sulfotelmatobacter sp.]